MRAWTLPVASALAVTLFAPAARATDCSGTVSSCMNDDLLWPHAGPSQFVAVGSTQTIAPGQLGFGLVTSYLNSPIVLRDPSPPPGSDQPAVKDLVNGTFLWSYGVTDRLELDIAVPLTFGQGGTGLEPITGGYGLKDTAVRDMRFGFAYAVVAHKRAGSDTGPFGLAARLEVSAPTGDSDQFAGEGTGVFVPSVSADWRQDRLFAGAELGARIRPTTQLESGRIGTELLAVLGVGYDVLPRHGLAATLEAWALPDLVRQAQIGAGNVSTLTSSYIVPSEWQLGARWAPLRGGDLSIQASGGGGIPIGAEDRVTTPKFRFTLGVRWAPLGRDTDGDGRHGPDGARGRPAPVVDARRVHHRAGPRRRLQGHRRLSGRGPGQGRNPRPVRQVPARGGGLRRSPGRLPGERRQEVTDRARLVSAVTMACYTLPP
jgi:OOP family OmpA-OmpF porin